MKAGETVRLHSRHVRNIRNFDDLPLLDALLLLIATGISDASDNVHRVRHFRFACTSGRGGLLVVIILEVAIGQIPVLFRSFVFVDRSVEVF